MNTLSQEHYAAALTGAPPGYVGAKEGTTLLEQDKLDGSPGRPGIVLFDELEKASPEVSMRCSTYSTTACCGSLPANAPTISAIPWCS